MSLRALLVAGFLAVPARGAIVRSSQAAEFDLLSVGGFRSIAAMPLLAPFERLLAERAADVELLAVETVPAYHNGNLYRFRLEPPPAAVGETAGEAVGRIPAIESDDGFFSLWPEEPELFARFEAAARRPEMYRRPMAPRVAPRGASVTLSPAPEGGVLHALALESPRAVADQWRKTVATVYHLRVRGVRREAVFLGKTLGGLARLPAALERARRPGRPAIVVSRGSPAREAAAVGLSGRALWDALEGLGLQVSALGLGEFRRWDELLRYREERPEGIRFLSANLVLSSAPATLVFPPTAVLEAGGARVGFLGLTRQSHARFLAAGPLRAFSVADPVAAALAQVRGLRERADVVVVLGDLDESDHRRLCDGVRGIDLVLGLEEPFLPSGAEPRTVRVSEPARGPYDACLLSASDFEGAVGRLEVSWGAVAEERRPVEAAQSHVVLDESLADQPGLPDFSADVYGASASTDAVLLPSARRLFPDGSPEGPRGAPTLSAREFWRLAGALMAERTGAEAALLPALPISVRTAGDFREAQVRDWLGWDDTLVAFELTGAELRALLDQAASQAAAVRKGIPLPTGAFPLEAAGASGDGLIHGAAIRPEAVYRVAGTELLLGNTAALPAIAGARRVERWGSAREEIVAALRRKADVGWPPERYRALTRGEPVAESSVWLLNFRDVGLNVRNTRVVRDPAFARVPDARVQGFDEQLIGVIAKVDADYQARDYRWSNVFELEYSRSRLRPPGQPEVVNTPSNRVGVQTTGTRRAGAVGWPRVARSYGPSLGLGYEGEVEKTPGLRRKETYTLFPGVELFDGTLLRTVQLSASLKRDFSRAAPNTQYGLRERVVLSAPVGRSAARLEGELWSRYFFLTRRDAPEDLRLEGDLNLKLQIPVYRQFMLAPFLDLYFFELKTRPLAGYSFITGVSLGFSRLWKPGYERF